MRDRKSKMSQSSTSCQWASLRSECIRAPVTKARLIDKKQARPTGMAHPEDETQSARGVDESEAPTYSPTPSNHVSALAPSSHVRHGACLVAPFAPNGCQWRDLGYEDIDKGGLEDVPERDPVEEAMKRLQGRR